MPALQNLTVYREVRYGSLSFHPWTLPEGKFPLPEAWKEDLSKCAALGEVGLDRCRGGAWDVQCFYLDELLQAALELRKPVVFHCVRAFPELFRAVRDYPLTKLLHGFCGGVPLLRELWGRGFTVSFHPSVLNREDLLRELLSDAHGAYGLESDDDERADVRHLSAVLGEKLHRDVEKETDQYFAEFLQL